MRKSLLLLPAVLVLTGANVFGQLMWGAGGTGGSGQWSSVNQNWWNGSANVSWPGGEAIFAGAAGTVSISSNVSAEKLDFNAPGYVLDSGTLNAGTGTLTVEANADAVINSAMYGSSFGSFNLVKTGAASVTLTGSVNAARMTIGAGDLRVAGSSSTSSTGVCALADAPGVFFTLAGGDGAYNFLGGLTGGGTLGGIVRPEAAGAHSLYLGSAGSSFGGSIQDNGAGRISLGLSGAVAHEFTGASPFTGSTTVGFGTTLAFRGGGTFSASAISVESGTLLVDNSGAVHGDRLSDSAPLTLQGAFVFRGNASAIATETAGVLTPVGGMSTVAVNPDPAQPAALTFAGLAPHIGANTGLLLFQGANLGAAPAPGVANLFFQTAPPLLGGSATSAAIVPAALGGDATGSSFVTYGAQGIRPLGDAEYGGDFAGTLPNVNLATARTLSAATAITALRVQDGAALGGNGALSIASGAILAQPGSATLAVKTLDFGAQEAVIFAQGNLTVSSDMLGTNALNGLTKVGDGRLTMTGTNSYRGVTRILGGVLNIQNGAALGDASEGIEVTGGVLEMQGGIAVAGESLSLRSTLRNVSGDNAWNGSADIFFGTLAVPRGSLTFGGSVTITKQTTKTGSGSLIFNQNLTGNIYDFFVRGGTVATRVASGNPLADAAILLDGSTFACAPAGTGADVTLSLTGKDGFLDGTLTYSGGATLTLDKGANQSLTVRLSPPAGFAPLARVGTGTLTIAPVGGLASLGTTQKILLDVASPATVLGLTGGVVTVGIVGQDSDANRSGDLLTYDATAGLTRAVFSTGTNLNTATPAAPFHATTPQTLTRPVSVRGLKNSGQTINVASFPLHIFDGLVMNGGSITGSGTVSATTVYTSLAGGTIASNVSGTIVTCGPGALTLSGNQSGNLDAQSGTVVLSGAIAGTVQLAAGATLKGSGSIGGIVSGGTISPGTGAGILKAATLAPTFGGGSFADPLPGAFAFEFTRLGAPVFGSANASGNDVLRLTHAFTPFFGALTADNEINVYFGIGAGVRAGDTFLGGFYTDRNAAFTTSIASATYRYFVVDPLGDTTFNGTAYSAFTSAPVEVSTVPQAADFGAGNVIGTIAQFRIVPEPAVTALLLAATGILRARRRRSPGRSEV